MIIKCNIRNYYWLFIALFICACSKEVPGVDSLKLACEKNAGIRINKTVKTEGYYVSDDNCSLCWMRLAHHNFDYIEFNISDGYNRFFPKEGMWRLSRKDKGDPDCDSALNQEIIKKKLDKRLYSFSNKYCLKKEKIDSRKSKYTILSNYDLYFETDKVDIHRLQNKVVNEVTGAVLGERIDYFLRPYKSSALSYMKIVNCSSVGINAVLSKEYIELLVFDI